MRLALDAASARARVLLQVQASQLPAELVTQLLAHADTHTKSDGNGESYAAAQRARVAELRRLLAANDSPEVTALREASGALLPRSVWIVGGDGWAYDIGYGGLDHVLASHRKVNVLVLDTEVYSNTGGQQSKATPLGAAAKFATAGKSIRKKDLGLLAMSYGHVYVAQVGMQSHAEQTVQAMLEAERHPGPPLVIAHSPCIAHGYDLLQSPLQQKRAIDSGTWPLYRFDPHRVDRGEAPLLLDSGPPRIDVAEFMAGEARFRMVELRSPQRYRELQEAARDAVRQRQALYEQLAKIHLPPGQHHD
jgi:pyruvate-ferredoxin/flavodoxin oxidoreductase